MTGPLDPAAREPGRQAGAGPGEGAGQTPGAGQIPGAGQTPDYPRQQITVFLDGLAAGAPAPAAGSALALVLAQAAGLCAKTARLSGRRLGAARADDLTTRAENLRATATGLMDQDALAYGAVITALRRSRSAERDPVDGNTAASTEVARALSDAADVPMRIVDAAWQLVDIAAELAADGNPALRGDALSAAILGGAAARAAAELVGINLAAAPADPRHLRCMALLAEIAARLPARARGV